VPFFLPMAPPGILSYRYRARKMGFRPFRPFRPALAHLSRYRAGGPWRGFPQSPQALCQSRGPARAARCQDLVIPAISASDMPMAGGLAWQAWDGELREHGSWRPGILSHRMEVRKSTSGAAAGSVTERWRCGRLSRRASMMPIQSRWGSAGIRHNIAQFCQRPSAGTRPGRFTAPAAEPSKDRVKT
jgi:hypothetical protein